MMDTKILDLLAHDITRITEAIRQESIRHSRKITELDIELSSIKIKIQEEISKEER